MKKLLSVLFISVMLLSALAMNVGAADEAFTYAEAKAIFADAYSRIMLSQYGEYYVPNDDGTETNETTNGNLPGTVKITTVDGGSISVDKNMKGEPFVNNTSGFANKEIYNEVVIETPDGKISSYDKMLEYIREVYTDEYAAEVVEISGYAGVDVYRGDSGKLYKHIGTYALDGVTGGLNHFAGYVEGLEVNGDVATMKVILRTHEVLKIDGEHPEGAEYTGIKAAAKGYGFYWVTYEKTVTFKKTSDGWRISGGSFFDTILKKEKEFTVGMKVAGGILTIEEAYGVSNPNTSDPTAILVALLALSGLALACVPAVKRRKI